MAQGHFDDQLQSVTEKGYTDGGDLVQAAYSVDGSQKVAVECPLMPKGSIHSEKLNPALQMDATYGVNSKQIVSITSNGGTITTSDANFVLSTGVTAFGQAAIITQHRLRARPQQGVINRFNALFSAPVTNSIQLAGAGHAEDGVFIGYFLNSNFSIVYNRGGVREVRTLTITTASSTNENVTVTLGGVAHAVPVTNSGNINRTAYEIANFANYSGYRATAIGNTVVFVANSPGPIVGAFTLAGTTAAGTFATTKTGVSVTRVIIPQSQFNVDKLDGTGLSGFTLDPAKGNTFTICIDPGYGIVSFAIEVPGIASGSDSIIFHRIIHPNTATVPLFNNNSFAMSYSAVSAGSTTNVVLKGSTAAGFTEGDKFFAGGQYSYYNTKTSISTTLTPLFTIHNNRTYKGFTNQAQIYLRSIQAAVKHGNPVNILIFKNAPLLGNPNFSAYDSDSCSLYDTDATGLTISSNSNIIWAGAVGETGNTTFNFVDSDEEHFIAPGEWYTVAASTVTGSAAYVTASINTTEDV